MLPCLWTTAEATASTAYWTSSPQPGPAHRPTCQSFARCRAARAGWRGLFQYRLLQLGQGFGSGRGPSSGVISGLGAQWEWQRSHMNPSTKNFGHGSPCLMSAPMFAEWNSSTLSMIPSTMRPAGPSPVFSLMEITRTPYSASKLL